MKTLLDFKDELKRKEVYTVDTIFRYSFYPEVYKKELPYLPEEFVFEIDKSIKEHGMEMNIKLGTIKTASNNDFIYVNENYQNLTTLVIFLSVLLKTIKSFRCLTVLEEEFYSSFIKNKGEYRFLVFCEDVTFFNKYVIDHDSNALPSIDYKSQWNIKNTYNHFSRFLKSKSLNDLDAVFKVIQQIKLDFNFNSNSIVYQEDEDSLSDPDWSLYLAFDDTEELGVGLVR